MNKQLKGGHAAWLDEKKKKVYKVASRSHRICALCNTDYTLPLAGTESSWGWEGGKFQLDYLFVALSRVKTR